jgi:hypothetical protein
MGIAVPKVIEASVVNIFIAVVLPAELKAKWHLNDTIINTSKE